MKARLFLLFLGLELLVLLSLVVKDPSHSQTRREHRQQNAELADILQLTDLALWTEARYTRHPSQADGFAAFQEGPAALDYFPAGTWIPPQRLRGTSVGGSSLRP